MLLLCLLVLCLGSSHRACRSGSWVQSVPTMFPLHTATGSALHSHLALPTAPMTCQKHKGAARLLCGDSSTAQLDNLQP